MAHGAGDRGVGELAALARAAKQKAPAAHVAASHEIGREEQTGSEHVDEQIDVLARGDASEQNDLGSAARPPAEAARVAFERFPVERVFRMDVDFGEGPQILESDGRVDGDESPRRRDDERSRGLPLRSREALRILQLASEIQAGEKCEDLAERRGALAEPHRQLEAGLLAKEDLRSEARATRG